MEDRLSKIEAIAERIDGRLANIEARENERKGVLWTLSILAAVIGGTAGYVGAIMGHLLK